MQINPASIEQNSQAMFAILSQAQATENNLVQKVAESNTSAKLNAQTDATRGAAIDVLA